MTLKAVPINLPEPPYPADTKANGYKLEVDWARIKSSKTWRLCSPAAHNHLLRLWAESWNEVPLGSWENEDELIAIAIETPLEIFKLHRNKLLRGWILHSDRRLYHPYITDQVLDMLSKRRQSTERQRKKRENRVTRDSQGSARDVRVGTGTGTGTGTGKALKAQPLKWQAPEKLNLQAWKDFEAHREELRQKLTDRAKTKNANVLVNFSPAEQQEMIDETIRNNWKGIFPLKKNNGNGGAIKNTAPTRPNFSDVLKNRS